MSYRVGSQDLPELAENLQWLIDRLPDPSGERWTYAALAQACSARGAKISAPGLRHYASGHRQAPPAKLLFVLSDVLGVDPRFFWSDADRIKAEIEQLVRSRDQPPSH